jgi:ATP-dependent Lon protease
VPKQLEEHGLTPENLSIPTGAAHADHGYTREAGLRNLEREDRVRLRARSRARWPRARRARQGHADHAAKYLGAPKILPEEILKKDAIGIATGLAWTATGGDVLFIEATAMKGKGRLTLTGSLGDVMKESAQAALSYARTRAAVRHSRTTYFATHDLHIHVPEGRSRRTARRPASRIATAMLSVLHEPPGQALAGHDRRDHAARQRAADRRAQGEDAGRAPRRHHRLVLPKLNQKELDEIPRTCGAA